MKYIRYAILLLTISTHAVNAYGVQEFDARRSKCDIYYNKATTIAQLRDLNVSAQAVFKMFRGPSLPKKEADYLITIIAEIYTIYVNIDMDVVGREIYIECIVSNKINESWLLNKY